MIDIQIFEDPVVYQLGSIPITRTILTTMAVSAALIIAAALMRFILITRPESKMSALTEIVVSQLDALVTDVVGRPIPWLASFSGSLFLFIAACNLSGQLPGVFPPTANLSTTSALAIIVFCAVPIAGIASRGLGGYLKHYFSPNPLMFPLHLISELSRTLALSVRLFGNMMSGHFIVILLVGLSGFLVPTPLMALDLMIGLLQAYIFALLSTVFIGAALRSQET